MFDMVQPAGCSGFVPGGTAAMDAAVASRLFAGPAAAAEQRGWCGPALRSNRVVVARALGAGVPGAGVPGAGVPLHSSAVTAGAAVSGLALCGGPAAGLRNTGTVTPADGIAGAVERLVGSLAVGFTVFTVSLAAFMFMFAWWILVVEPSPGIQPLARVTMPLFP